jgi:hypothetical protein
MHPYIMTLGHEDEEGMKWHLYWYAKVLGIFHVNMRCLGCMETECMEFLWVHWFRCDLDYKGSFETCHLHHIGLSDSEDPTSYKFLNPNNILQSVHLIPAFALNERDPEVHNSDDLDNDTSILDIYYYVSIYVIHESSLHQL